MMPMSMFVDPSRPRVSFEILPDGVVLMLAKFPTKPWLVCLFRLLLVVYVIAASVLSVVHPECFEHTLELTLDGITVGGMLALTRLVQLLTRPHRRSGTLFSWWCLARLIFGHELRYGLLGGYLLGITHAVIACL